MVIPEKSSSFGIHPGRLCDDVCSYCHNKFGLYDTPLHIAQLKGFEKQQQVLNREPLITLESCLCDACYRHLERPLAIRGPKPAVVKQKSQPQANQTCCFTGCYQPAAHTMMRKWKRRAKSLLPEDLQDPKVTNWLCESHYSELARIGPCGLCLRRLNRQQMYELEASAVSPLNKLLRHDHIPVVLDSTMSLCKKCRFYTSLRLRTEDNSKLTSANRIFLKEHRVRVLKGRNLSAESLPDIFGETEKSKKLSKKKDKAPAETTSAASSPAPVQPPVVASSSTSSPNPAPTPNTSPIKITPKPKLRIKLNTPTRKMPTNARMSTGNPRMPPPPPPAKLSPAMATKSTASQVKLSSGIKLPSQTNITLQARPIAPAPPKLTSSTVQISPVLSRLAEKGELRRVTSQNSGSNLLSRIGLTKFPSPSATVTSNALQQTPQVTIVPIPPKQSAAKTSPRLQQSSRASTSTQQEEFPSTSEVAMNARFDFQTTDDSAAWQKVNATFQFDTKTRRLWNDLHAPYGSYTSFLRHLVLLESHWRNGDLVLAPTASTQSRQYLTSVQNRIKSYEGVPSEQDSALHSMPLISDVRSLATGENSDSWGAPHQ
ncbi:hypothetical protein B566_EDAN001922 [Ephemera danica]|nr:hypothetical protein B566_EDAN001922 [Ephemera danica]